MAATGASLNQGNRSNGRNNSRPVTSTQNPCAEILVNALHHQSARGLCHDSLSRPPYHSLKDPDAVRQIASLTIDRFTAFAEALGILFVEFPEWGRWGENFYVDLKDVYDRAANAFGAELAPPDCFGARWRASQLRFV